MNNKKVVSSKKLNQNIISIFLWSLMFSGLILLIDIYDIPSSVINKVPMEASIIVICLLLVVFALVLYNGHFLDLCKFPQINLIDNASTCVMCVSLICTVAWRFWLNQHTYKYMISLIFCILFGIVFIGRHTYILKYEKTDFIQDNIYDLKDIYEGKLKSYSETPVFVSEQDVSYDLLNRSGIINYLYMSIIRCKSDSAFVIGLEGEWGSGKTTIINNVKSKLENDNDTIIIDSFDPWMYGTQDALLMAMYDSILQKTDIKYSIFYEKKILKSLSNMLVDHYKAGGIAQNLLFPKHNDYEQTREIKTKLKQYIEKTNKNFVFFVDNMDRAEGNNIIFLIRLIGTIFDLPNIVYVLSYDRNRLNEILKDTTKINPKYVEKIINQEIRVPILQVEQLKKVYGTCIWNILKCYGVKEDDMSNFHSLIECIFASVKDLRMFKRMINSAFVSAFCQKNNLYKRDLLALEVIRFLQPELYSQINENKTFFVSHDRIIYNDIYYESIDIEKFNSEGKAFYENIFDKYGEYKCLLIEMFPYAKRVADKNELQSKYSYSNSDYDEISRNTRICSGKYFDLYFSYGDNEYLKIGKDIADMVEDIIKIKDEDQICDYMYNRIVNIPDDTQREWFERLESYLSLIPAEKKYILAKCIFDNIYIVDSSQLFMALNAQSRAVLNVELLLEKTEINRMREFAEGITDEYDKLYIIDQLIYWFKNTRSQHTDVVKERENILNEKISEMCEKVIEKNIDIYDDPYYVQYNIWGLIRYLNIKENREEILHAYFAKIINKKNIFRVIGDMISTSVGRGYGYKIDEEKLKLFFEDETIIDSILENIVPKTQSEEFVLKVYQKYKSDETDIWGEKQILSPIEIKLRL